MTSDTYAADVVIALAWLAMGTVASMWILAKLWRGGRWLLTKCLEARR